MQETNLVIGDKVKVLHANAPFKNYEGQTGKIFKRGKSGETFLVSFNDGGGLPFTPDDLAKVD